MLTSRTDFNIQSNSVEQSDLGPHCFRGPDKLSVQLGIYPTRFSSIAFFQKQLLNNIFYPTYIFEIAYL